jgi:hypothetical protein
MSTKTKEAMIVWLAQNRGILTKIAALAKPPVTGQFVGQIARGIRKSIDGKIERMLRSHGAPL